MKYLYLLLFCSFNLNAAMIDATCEKIEEIEVKIPVRIADKDLPYNSVKPIYRDADLKNGECLYKNTTAQCRNSDFPTPIIYNSKGYSSSEWSAAFPKVESPSEFEYCRYCKDLNDSLTNQYNNTYNAYFQVFDGVKYNSCFNKYGQIDNINNTDGCYIFRYEKQEVRTQYACQIYQCSEEDQIPGDFFTSNNSIYECPVFCTDYNHKALWEQRVMGYVCKKPPVPEPKGCGISKKESWDCLNDEVTQAFNDLELDTNDSIFSNLSALYNIILNYLSNKNNDFENNGNENNENNQNNEEIANSLKNVKIDSKNKNISISELMQSIFPTSVSCPSDNSISIMSNTYTFSYSKLCVSLNILGNLVMIFSIFISYKLIRSA